jgi:hypothetical protein
MTDTMGSPESIDDYNFEQWQIGIELKIKRLNQISVAEGVIAVGALGLAILGFKAVTNLAQSMQQMGMVVNGLSQIAWPPQQAGPVRQPPPPNDVNGRIDETVVSSADYGAPIAAPFMGPESETSERVKGLIASDPISPADLAKRDGSEERVAQEVTIDPKQDLA